MSNQLSYQQARKIRKTKFTDLFVDQLAQKDTGVFGAIGKSLSLKTQSKVKGIKEKFDPLNIAKFLTFGSKLGPALLGKLTGRSQKDIDYFTNRTRAIKGGYNTADKIKATPGGDTEGINEQLSKIYSFLKTSREEDVKLRESAKNFEEEIQMEKNRRHKELLDALKKLVSSVGPGGTATPVKEQPSFFEDLMEKLKGLAELIGEMKTVIAEMAKRLGMPIANALVNAGRTVLGALGTPLGMAAGVTAAFLTPFALSAIEKEKIDKDPYAKEYDNNAYALSVRSKKEGGKLTEGAAAEQLRNKSVKQIPRNQVEDFVKSDLTDKEIKQELGADRPTLKKWLAENPKRDAMWQAPVAGVQTSTNTATPVTPPAATATEKPVATTGAPTPQATSGKMEKPASTATPAAPAPVSSSVAPLTNTNTELNLTQQMSSVEPGVSKTVVNNTTKTPSSPALKPSQISVRNDEPTFMRLIEQSTRLV